MELPFDMLLEIALCSLESWSGMLAIPAVGRFSITQLGKSLAEKRFKQLHDSMSYLGRFLHSFDDLPAITGDCDIWYSYGEIHRDNDLPAVITYSTPERHYSNWKLVEASATAPRIIWKQEWYVHGERHRDNDRPAIVHHHGDKEWFHHGNRHREDGKVAQILQLPTYQIFRYYTHGKFCGTQLI